MKTYLLISIVLIATLLSSSMLFAADSLDLPADFPKLVIEQYGQTSPGIFIGWFGFNNPEYYVVLDQTGYPLFYSKTEQMSYPGVMCNGLITSPSSKGYNLKDETFTVVDSFQLDGDYSVDIHDFRVLPNGHALILGTHSVPVDMSRIVTGGRLDAHGNRRCHPGN